MRKNDPKVRIGKMKTKTWFLCFFKCLLHFRADALQSELNKVSISNFVKFRLQRMNSKIERAFEKTNQNFHQNRAIKDIYKVSKRTINQCKIPHMRKKHIFFLE